MTIIFSKKQKTIKDTIYLSGKSLHSGNESIVYLHPSELNSGIRINDLKMNELEKPIISNVTAKETTSSREIKSLLISQIEKKVRWLECVEYMINNGVKNFVEIGPGKVLSGLIKRINKNVNVNSINNEEDIKLLIND